MTISYSIFTRYGRYKRVFRVLGGFIEKLTSCEYIVIKENKKISYETKGYRIWVKFRKNKVVIEHYRPSRQDYDIWYVNQYLGHQVAGKYSRILFYAAALISLTLVSLNPGYANFAVLVVGVFIVLDYILHVYYNWSLIKLHNEAYQSLPAYKDLYDRVRDEILRLLTRSGNESLRTIVFLDKTWFRKTIGDQEILAKHPV